MPFRYSLLRPSASRLDCIRVDSGSESLTYTAEGATVTGEHPAGFHSHAAELTARVEWESARAAIRQWSGHRSTGAVLSPDTPPLDIGTTMTFGVRVLGVWATGACRIVRVIDEEERFGFSYGTLPHHPETGEEMFAATDNRDGTVTFEVAAFSRPAGLLTSMLGPIGRIIQRVMTRRYLQGFADWASSASATKRR